MWGQHGDHLVPMWSSVRARGVSDQHLADVLGTARAERSLLDLPEEIRTVRGRALDLVNAGDVVGSYNFIQQQRDLWDVDGIVAISVLLDHHGWSQAIALEITDDERAALTAAAKAIQVANRC